MCFTHCPFCGGDLAFVPCPECHGSSWVTHYQSDELSASASNAPCGKCGGTGRMTREQYLKEMTYEDSERFSEAWKELAKEQR